MRKENKRLNLDDDFDNSPSTPVEEDFEELDLQSNDDPAVTEEPSDFKEAHGVTENGNDASEDSELEPDNVTKSSREASDMDDEYGSREEVENRLLRSIQANNSTAASTAASEDDGALPPKLGKAKAKRAKKAARQEAEVSTEQENKCAGCSQSFTSKTKLFDHLKAMPKHAQPVLKAKRKNKKL